MDAFLLYIIDCPDAPSHPPYRTSLTVSVANVPSRTYFTYRVNRLCAIHTQYSFNGFFFIEFRTKQQDTILAFRICTKSKVGQEYEADSLEELCSECPLWNFLETKATFLIFREEKVFPQNSPVRDFGIGVSAASPYISRTHNYHLIESVVRREADFILVLVAVPSKVSPM